MFLFHSNFTRTNGVRVIDMAKKCLPTNLQIVVDKDNAAGILIVLSELA